MLGMIEINLLPQEYRVQERTPMGFILTVVIGICVVGGIVIYGFSLRQQLAEATDNNGRLQEREKKAKEIEAKVDKADAEIKNAQKRQNTIIEISQTKILWSLKLVQFGRILVDYPSFWIDRLALERGRGTSGVVTLQCYALGQDLRNIARFRERLKGDTNFWYHFEGLESYSEQRVLNGGPLSTYDSYKGPVMKFNVSMPVK